MQCWNQNIWSLDCNTNYPSHYSTKIMIGNCQFHLELVHSLSLIIPIRCYKILYSLLFAVDFSIWNLEVIKCKNIFFAKSFFDRLNFVFVGVVAFRFWNLFFLFFKGSSDFLEICWSCCLIMFRYFNIQNLKRRSL